MDVYQHHIYGCLRCSVKEEHELQFLIAAFAKNHQFNAIFGLFSQ